MGIKTEMMTSKWRGLSSLTELYQRIFHDLYSV